MLKAEHIETYGWEAAIRGARNPLNSWSMSDSMFYDGFDGMEAHIGERDMDLMRRLVKAGSDHGKFMRMIGISMDIVAPLYWWKEYDTYKVGTVADSCSTMHKIHSKEFTEDDFSHEHLVLGSRGVLDNTINALNCCRHEYLETKDKMWWWQMIQLLPSSYNQRRTVTLNYQVARNMYHARKGHKLDEWHELCRVFESLPYSELIMEV